MSVVAVSGPSARTATPDPHRIRHDLYYAIDLRFPEDHEQPWAAEAWRQPGLIAFSASGETRQEAYDALNRRIGKCERETRVNDHCWIPTATGRRMYLQNPCPADVDIEDLAISLSREPRFRGMTRAHYSVAQHSVLVSRLLPRDLQLAGLLHDAAEAYLGDMSCPLKMVIEHYRRIERNVASAIAWRFGIPTFCVPQIKQMDLVVLVTEIRDLKPRGLPAGRHWGVARQETLPSPLNCTVIEPWGEEESYDEFMGEFRRLTEPL